MSGFADFVRWVGGATLLGGEVLRQLVRRPFEGRQLARQLEHVGVESVPIVALTALFTGMVLALQTAHALAHYGTKHLVGQVVALSLVREMGPVLTALMVGGRVGAGITAELGTMAVTEQVDAVKALGASPVKKLVVPRLLALLVMLPALTLLADAVGMAGGALIAVADIRQPLSVYRTAAFDGLALSDVFSGLGKSFAFALFIGLIACYQGLQARGGADGVGRATTSTVVAASITVLISDFFLTKLFLFLT